MLPKTLLTEMSTCRNVDPNDRSLEMHSKKQSGAQILLLEIKFGNKKVPRQLQVEEPQES